MIFGGLDSAGDLLARNARNFPNDVGLIFGEKHSTWKELDGRAKAFANSLVDLGLERGDRVAIYAKNSNQWVEALFGLAQVGLISVTVNYRLTASEVKFIVENSGAKAIICDESTEQNSLEVREKVTELKHVINSEFFENLISNFKSEISHPQSAIRNPMMRRCFSTLPARPDFRKARFIRTVLCSSECWFTFTRLLRGKLIK